MMAIRKATSKEVLAVQKLLRETWLYTYSNHLSQATLDEVYKTWQSVEFLTKQIQNPDFYFPLAVEADKVVGVATARSVDGVTVLFRLYVDSHYQRRGIGEKLLRTVFDYFPENKKVQLYVEALNIKGQAFYHKHGFKEVKREKEKIVTEIIEQVLMEKEF
jgi:ribosomal protein S18 acetylase RimI-like enzyme